MPVAKPPGQLKAFLLVTITRALRKFWGTETSKFSKYPFNMLIFQAWSILDVVRSRTEERCRLLRETMGNLNEHYRDQLLALARLEMRNTYVDK